MLLEVPNPPPGSRFQLGEDGWGRPRLIWPCHFTLRGCLTGGGFTVVLCLIFWQLLWLIQYEIASSPPGSLWDRVWAQLERRNGKLLGLFAALALFGFFLALILRGVTVGLLTGRNMKRRALTFGRETLWYQPNLAGASGAPWLEIPRDRVRAIGVVGKGRAERLLVAARLERWEIGPTLGHQERAWLAGLLRAWAGLDGPAALPDVPAPPADSWIRLYQDAEEHPRLHWLPPDDLCRAGRRAFLRRTLAWFVRWAGGEAVLVGLLAYLLRSGLGCVLWLLVPAIAFALLLCSAAGLAIIIELAGLTHRSRPECLTLTRDVLHYDPGHFYCGPACSTGRPQEINRAEVARVRLEYGPGGRDRLLIDLGPPGRGRDVIELERIPPAGVNRAGSEEVAVEVGPCLQPFERAWLAGVLRRWAGLPDA